MMVEHTFLNLKAGVVEFKRSGSCLAKLDGISKRERVLDYMELASPLCLELGCENGRN